jgi:hypothetical protein
MYEIFLGLVYLFECCEGLGGMDDVVTGLYFHNLSCAVKL